MDTEEKKDIHSLEDIRLLVDTFYDKVRIDNTIGPVFDTVIGGEWPRHLDKMYRFWQTVLLGEHTYNGAPFAPHAKLDIDKKHFDRWLSLFAETLTLLFSGPKADEALWRAEKMAVMFRSKLEYIQNNPDKFLLH